MKYFLTVLTIGFLSNNLFATKSFAESGTFVHPNMIQYLEEGGQAPISIVTDAAILTKANAKSTLVRVGFNQISAPNENPAVLVAGPRPSLYGVGQRAVFYENGDVILASFGQNKKNGASFVQSISISKSGEVKNELRRLP